ncbi:interleukin-13 receptor subunit alpha-1 [Leuresthes tenuis]|uniref:interleukin-13 receptor subunit alpha-1 n=1 Tax=Leuresthes tenuis TaxID=355514 RepID=UPI003B50E9C3
MSECRTHLVMQGGVLRCEVKIVCGDNESEVAHYNVNYTELVTNLNCYISTARQAHCSWSPASNATDLSFFYLLVKMFDSAPPSQLKECSSYINTDGVKTGCDLQATSQEDIYILLNGTLNNATVRNTFTFELKDNVKPPPLIWKATKSGSKLNISWTPPEVLSQDFWEFNINYTECDKLKNIDIKQQVVTSHLMNLVPHCRYCITIRASSSKGKTPWSDQKCFEADANWLVYTAVIIPLVIACLAALTFKCYWKNKEKMFPKVPKPRDLLTDISDNNNESTHCNMYIPVEEDENCKVTLVTDTQIS